MTGLDVVEATGPEQIRAAFTTAIDTTSSHTEDLTGIAGILSEAADRYEALGMTASTLEHLRNGADAVTTAATALDTTGETLQAALADFNTHDGRVADAVTEAGNLMQAEGYTTTFDPTGVQEQPMTSPAADPSPADAATPDTEPAGDTDDRSDRDRLARGFYLNGWGRYQQEQARKWDAGRADPEAVATAYEVADKLLAEQAAIATGPGADRLEAMRDNGITRCPDWCPQVDDEHQYEEHIGPGSTFTTDDGDTVTVRPHVSWWSDVDPSVEIAITPAEGADGTLRLSGAELAQLQQVSSEVLAEAQRQHAQAPGAEGQRAYPGALLEDVDAAWDVSPAAAAAAALDLKNRAGGYYFHEDDDTDDGDGPYLDWSSRDTATLVRHLEVGDGTDTAVLDLTSEDLRELRDGVGRLVGAVDDDQDDPGALYPGDEDEGAYIDWSSAAYGVRSVEFGDGVDAVVVEMPESRLREWYERLALQVQLDEQGDAA